jgi:HEPN domain-containing protein
MQPSALAEAREWLARADEDLAAAKRMTQTPPPLLGIASYHAQQAAEKALKAFLAAQNTTFRPTHNLEELLPACLAIDVTFGQFALTARTLTPYAVRFRYPGGPLAPTQADGEQALQLATDLVEFVHGQLRV